MKKAKSLAELGLLAGVSAATVSRALKNSSEISEKMKEKIRKLAIENNYILNTSARNLRMQKTNTVAVILNASDKASAELSEQPYVLNILGNLSDELARRGLDMMVSSKRSVSQCWNQYFLQSNRADAIIILGQGADPSILTNLAHLNTPFVVYGAYTDQNDYCVIGCNSKKAAETATIHLIKDAGKKKVLYLGPTENFEAKERIEGYKDAINKQGLLVDQALIQNCELSVKSALQVLSKIIDAKLSFDAIFACNDDIAIGALKCLKEKEISVPNTVSIVGFDNIPAANYVTPALTTISQNQDEVANMLVNNVLDVAAGKSVKSSEIPFELVVRASSVL